MLKINNIRVRIGVFFVLLVLPLLRVSAQDVSSLGEENLSFKDRIAIRTNVVDWALTIPNIAFDYDIVNTPYDKRSVGVGLKYNWNASHHRLNGDDWLSRAPGMVFNLFDARVDYRFYWRQQPFDNRSDAYGDWEREWIQSSKGFDKLRARVNCFRAAEKPKAHLSFFVGPYLSASTFSFKLGAEAVGRQGFAVGAGLTGGVALPLYGYENGAALDLEFGGSLGLHFSSFDFYKMDVENEEFQSSVNNKGRDHRNLFLPFPSELRVSLVYRFRSISKQHTEINYALIDRRYVAHLMKGDLEEILAYNDSISELKAELDRRNQEIALYKQTVESEPGFNKAYSLEYLTPYVYMMEAPKQYTRLNKDTLPKVEIDSFEQIVDPVLLSVREQIDSIPGLTSAEIDKKIVIKYNSISGVGNSVNRTALIREIYCYLNDEIKNNNNRIIDGTVLKTDTFANPQDMQMFNAKSQRNLNVGIVYEDSQRAIEMTQNDRIEWLNNIKKQAWSDERKRMQGEYPGRVELPEVYDFLAGDSVQTDSVQTDSLASDSMRLDSAFVEAILTDSLKSDSVLIDSLQQVVSTNEGAPQKSKDKKSVKAAKSKKSAKVKKTMLNAGEAADSVTKVVADSVVTLIAQTDSVVDHIELDTMLQAKKTEKVEKVKKVKVEKAAKVKKAKKKVVEVVDSIKVDVLMADSLNADSVLAVAMTLCDDVLADTEKVVSAGYAKMEQSALLRREYIIKEEDED